MTSTSEELGEIDRIHDEAPEQAAARLRTLDLSGLPREQAPLAAFLFNHVLGEKFGDWHDAAQRIDRLRHQLSEVPPSVLVHAAVADQLAGHGASEVRAALVAASSEAVAACAIGLRRLSFTQEQMDIATFAATLRDLAMCTAMLAQNTGLDTQLAAGLNNATSRLLDLNPDVRDPVVREALQAGAAQALRFWQAAGTWVNHERALYLLALAANRVGAFAQARDAAMQALEVIAANGSEDVDRAFLLLQLAGAQQHIGDESASRTALSDAKAIAATWTEAWLTEWFATEEARLFGAPTAENDRC